MTKLYLASLLLILATACTPRTWYEKEIATLDTLYQRIDTSIAALARIDTLPYTDLNRKYAQNTNFVQAHYAQKGDTMHRDVALIMAEYRELKKPYGRYIQEYDRVEKELHFSKKQLYTLMRDLEHNLLDSTVVKRVYYEEKEAANKVLGATQSLIVSNAITRVKTIEIEPRIDSLIQALKAK